MTLRNLLRLRLALAAVAAMLLVQLALPREAQAQTSVSFTVSSAYFHQRLSPYGTWLHHTRWGDVWRPRAQAGFRPYMNGHWTNTTDYGVIFVSTAVWGDIVYHYGRWVYDPDNGWIWIPGYVWAPSWVIWRAGAGYVAWLPMPPCSNYYGSYFGTVGVYTGGFYDDRYYGYQCYQDWYGTSISFTIFLSYWTVVPEAHFFAPDLNRWRLHHRNYRTILPRTQNVTDYATVGDRVVNRSFPQARLDKILGKPVTPTPLRDAIRKNSIITPVPAGRTLERDAGPRVRRDFVPQPRAPRTQPATAPFTGVRTPAPATRQPSPPPRNERQPERVRRPGNNGPNQP